MVNTQVVKVEMYKYEKVKKSDVEIQIPTEPFFYQEWNHRVITGLFPEYLNTELWRIHIVKINETISITRAFFTISDLTNIISKFNATPKSSEDILIDDAVKGLLYHFGEDRVTEGMFDLKYKEFLESINNLK